MHHKAIYQKKNGQYFWAPRDDYTRTAYAEMGIRITNKDHVSSIVMAPTILAPRPKASEVYENTMEVVRQIEKSPPSIARLVSKFMSNRVSWSGTTEQLATLLAVDKEPRHLMQQSVVSHLADFNISVSRRRSNGKRILVLESSRGS